jgi:hypothetical protein
MWDASSAEGGERDESGRGRENGGGRSEERLGVSVGFVEREIEQGVWRVSIGIEFGVGDEGARGG